MIEPTESGSKAEIDRFCDAMIAIRQEIREIETGRMPKNDNPLKNAPHTALDLVDEEWKRPYPRALGCFPAGLNGDKYWRPVNRIDNAYGDRHLVCTCMAPALQDDEIAEKNHDFVGDCPCCSKTSGKTKVRRPLCLSRRIFARDDATIAEDDARARAETPASRNARR